jgi:hypothetical protein
MRERYESRDVAVLVYHLHIPGPDPMANPDAESRTKYYGVGGTPTAVFDGTDKNVAGGSASGAQRNFGLCKGKVEARTGLKPPVAIGSLNLRIEGSVATLSGEVIADADALKSPDKARLRLALVEELCGLLRFIAVTCSHSFAVSSATKATPSSHRG